MFRIRSFYVSSLKNLNNILFALVVALMFGACGKTTTDNAIRGEFRYYNRCPDVVVISLRGGINQAFGSYIVNPGDSLVIHTTNDGPENAPPGSYRPGIAADTVTIQFNDTLCYHEYHKAGAELHNISNYTWQQRGPSNYLFFYTIDSNLAEKGGACY